MTGQSPAGGANNQAAGSKTGINATPQGQKMASPHSTQPAGDKDVTQRPATSSPTGGAGLGVGEMSINSETAGSYHAQADKQGAQHAQGIGQGMGDKHSHEVHKDRAGSGVVPGTGNATSGDETIGGTGNAGSQDTGTSMDKASRGSKGSNLGSKTLETGGSSSKRGFATKASGSGHASSGASSNTGNTTMTSGIGSAPTSGTKTGSSSGSNTGSNSGSSSGGSTAGKGNSHTGGSSATASAAGTTGSGSNSGGAKSNLGTSSSGGASTTNSTNSPGMGGAGSAGSSASSAKGSTGTTGKGSGDIASDDTHVESNAGHAGAVGSTGSPRVGGSVGGGAARANTGEHSPSGTAGGVGTGGTTTMESVKEKVRDYTGDTSASMPAASSYTVIAAVLLGVPLLFVLDPDRAYLKKQHMEREKQLQEEYH